MPASVDTRPPVDGPDDAGRTWSVGRIAAVATALALIVFWIWVFAGGPKKANPDRIADRAWATRAERTCATTTDELDALPIAAASPDTAARAAVVTKANDDLGTMLAALTADKPSSAADADVIDPWLADWRALLAARRDYAERLATDADARLLLDEKFGNPLDDVVQTFAEVNDMDSCAPPTDVS